MTKVKIPHKRKCYGTFDLRYDSFNEHIPHHGRKMLSPKRGILSFKTEGTEVEIEFLKEQWEEFIDEMKKVEWVEKEHFGAC